MSSHVYLPIFTELSFHETLLNPVYRILIMYCFLNEKDWNLRIGLGFNFEISSPCFFAIFHKMYCFHETLLSRVYRILIIYCFLNDLNWNLFIVSLSFRLYQSNY